MTSSDYHVKIEVQQNLYRNAKKKKKREIGQWTMWFATLFMLVPFTGCSFCRILYEFLLQPNFCMIVEDDISSPFIFLLEYFEPCTLLNLRWQHGNT
jgi:hypothetical protein